MAISEPDCTPQRFVVPVIDGNGLYILDKRILKEEER